MLSPNLLEKASAPRTARRLALAIVLVTALSGCGGQGYSCGNPAENHCYGIVTWPGVSTGLSTAITAVSLTSGDGLVNDEAWLVDDEHSTSGAEYWVEAGEGTDDTGSTNYFWAEDTPGSGYMSYELGPVEESDTRNGAFIAYSISQDAAVSNQWDITVSRAATGQMLYSVQSTQNSMTPNKVDEGLELAGQQNAQAPFAFFSRNMEINGAKETPRSDDGTVREDLPPTANWFGNATPSNSNNGGLFFTYCC
jgi:hypothetical protein